MEHSQYKESCSKWHDTDKGIEETYKGERWRNRNSIVNLNENENEGYRG